MTDRVFQKRHDDCDPQGARRRFSADEPPGGRIHGPHTRGYCTSRLCDVGVHLTVRKSVTRHSRSSRDSSSCPFVTRIGWEILGTMCELFTFADFEINNLFVLYRPDKMHFCRICVISTRSMTSLQHGWVDIGSTHKGGWRCRVRYDAASRDACGHSADGNTWLRSPGARRRFSADEPPGGRIHGPHTRGTAPTA